jgi:hypothetical protein
MSSGFPRLGVTGAELGVRPADNTVHRLLSPVHDHGRPSLRERDRERLPYRTAAPQPFGSKLAKIAASIRQGSTSMRAHRAWKPSSISS